MNLKTSAGMSTKTVERPVLCDTMSSSGNMESVHCNWSVRQGNQIPKRSRPMSETLSKLAQLITCMEYKPKSQTSSSICKDSGQKSSDLNTHVRQQQKEQAVPKIHCCQRCGEKFALLSSLQLHLCIFSSSVCQTCMGKTSSSCPSCGIKPSIPSCTEDNSPYACTPCGQAFSQKQDLLHHQQAGNCQTLKPSVSPYPRNTTCTLCSRMFRAPTGLACHMRLTHGQTKSSPNIKNNVTKKKVLISGALFPCRSCDKSFSKTSHLHRHRREEHRRDVKVRNPSKSSLKVTRQRRKGDTYPCLHCGKEFLHHLTRWAHFKHYSTHHQMHLKLGGKSTGTELKPKQAKELVEDKTVRKRGRPKKCVPALTVKTRQKYKLEDEDEDEDAEYPCTSCAQVFSSKNALYIHEKVHEELPEEEADEPAETCGCCSVCSCGIPHHLLPEDCEKKVYHCVPCAETFIALDAFLEHCQKHLIREHEDEFSDD